MDLDDPKTWSSGLWSVLESHAVVFDHWYSHGPCRKAQAFDQAIQDVVAALNELSITGWHCSRMTEQELSDIREGGLKLPTSQSLRARIEALQAQGIITRSIAESLICRNQASDPWRVGRIWFCFFPPRLAGEDGICRFFQHWGGEALYNSHERDATTSPVLRQIGIPTVVEGEIRIGLLENRVQLADQIAQRRWQCRLRETNVEPFRFEGCITAPLEPRHIRRIVCFPEAEFFALTGADMWKNKPLK